MGCPIGEQDIGVFFTIGLLLGVTISAIVVTVIDIING
jgi:hypothetical protein